MESTIYERRRAIHGFFCGNATPSPFPALALGVGLDESPVFQMLPTAPFVPYTDAVSSTKGEIGIVSRCCPTTKAVASPQSLRLRCLCPQFWRLGWGAARPAGSRRGSPVDQPVRAAALDWSRVRRFL